MKSADKSMKAIMPINQLNLFGYHYFFDAFIKLYKKNKLPNVILLNGFKGIGKATFAFHFTNYLLSINDENKYLIDKFEISQNNISYKLLSNQMHPNFFLLQNNIIDENIKIDQVRDLLKFLNKSTFSRDLKIVIIDNAEYLNLNSSNALLKSLEEPNNNTFFFMIYNNRSKILNTIKSRCIEFKITFSIEQKKTILKNIVQQYELNYNLEKFNDNFFSDTPGNLLKYLMIFNDSNIDINKDKLSCILYLIEKYKSKKDSELLSLISSLVERHYTELSLNNNENLNFHYASKNKIINQINNIKKFNLDKKNFLISLEETLKNEAR